MPMIASLLFLAQSQLYCGIDSLLPPSRSAANACFREIADRRAESVWIEQTVDRSGDNVSMDGDEPIRVASLRENLRRAHYAYIDCLHDKAALAVSNSVDIPTTGFDVIAGCATQEARADLMLSALIRVQPDVPAGLMYGEGRYWFAVVEYLALRRAK